MTQSFLRLLLVICGLICSACSHFAVCPVAMAARAGDVAKIRNLASHGASVNQPSGVNDWPPLMHAIHKRQPKAVEALLQLGADPNLKGNGKESPLEMARREHAVRIEAILLEHGARSIACRQ